MFGLLFGRLTEMMAGTSGYSGRRGIVRAWARQVINEEESNMKANVGGFDRTLRIVGGIVLIALFFVLQGPARYLAILGLIALGTGLLSFCPLYSVLGINTCPKK
jgi:hypothetical protein